MCKPIARLLLPLLLATIGVAKAELAGESVKSVIDSYREQGIPFAYSTQLVDDSLKIVAEPTASDPVEIVRQLLKPYGLGIRTESEVHLVIRLGRDDSVTGRMLLVLSGALDNLPIEQASIVFEPPLASSESPKPGYFEFDDIKPGRYWVFVSAADFQSLERSIDVWPGRTEVVELSMQAEKPLIELIEVSASRYEISRDLSGSRFSLGRRDIQTMPDLGEDPLRAVQRLPGAAASGASAKTHLRGGIDDEIGIILNGQKLFDPFHVRDYQSIFSTIDSRAIEGVEVYTGGFPVQFGNRMSGMVLMDTLDTEGRHTEIGLSVYNTSLLIAGNQDDKRWLFSTRRGNLDLVIDDELGSPKYFDVFGEFAWDPTPNMTISANVLFADDRIELILESDPEELERQVSDTRNAEAWVRINNRWSETLSSSTVLSATSFDNLRRGSLNDEEKIVAVVYDDRQISQFGFRQDFKYNPSDAHLLQWGLQVQYASAEYDYQNVAQYFGLQELYPGFDEPTSTVVAVSPDGASYALYFADRWLLSSGTSFEWGLRWDDQTYTGLSSDGQLSPRFSLLQPVGENTELRFSWGRYFQSQEINELQVEDGISTFWPAQRADQLIVGLRHVFEDDYVLRLEIFDKRLYDVQPRFENLFHPLNLIPEVQPDRVLLEPSSARSRGVEITLDRRSGPTNWWVTYVYSQAEDRIGGVDQRRSWDQPHAFQGGISFSNEKWDWAVSASVHSGWPSTELYLVEGGVDDDGEPVFVAMPGERNAGRYPTFASIDVRLARKWQLQRSKFSAFIEITNVTNRRNQCCLDWDLEEDEASGEFELERGVDYWMPIVPAVGVLWEF